MPSRPAPYRLSGGSLTAAAATLLYLALALLRPVPAPAQEPPAAQASPATAPAHDPTPSEPTHGVPTRLLVRAVTHDAKALGSRVGGARITVRDAATGAVLAEGVQEGGTGDTEAIMGARERGDTVFAHEGTAGFTASLELTAPTRVVVEARGPLGTPHAVQSASASLLLVPGVDVVGEGLVLQLHGFTVVFEGAVAADGPFRADALPVRARVTMLCGCPIEPGGLWDADRITITASLLRDGEVVASTPLAFAGETSVFEGELVPPGEGRYELRVTAVDGERANAGMASRELEVGPA